MMKCSYCGAKYPNAMPFCPVCGLLSPPRGQTMIRVVSILSTVDGGFSLLGYLLLFLFVISFDDRLKDIVVPAGMVLYSLFQFCFGIVGIIFANKGKDTLMILFGVILIALGAINGILWEFTIANSNAVIIFFSFTIRFILPVFYIIGGCMQRSTKFYGDAKRGKS